MAENLPGRHMGSSLVDIASRFPFIEFFPFKGRMILVFNDQKGDGAFLTLDVSLAEVSNVSKKDLGKNFCYSEFCLKILTKLKKTQKIHLYLN